MRSELATKDATIRTNESDLDSTKSDAAKKAAEISALNTEVEAEKAKVAAADAKLIAADDRIVDLRRRYTHHDEEVAKLTGELEARSAELASATADKTALAAKEAELKKSLEAAKIERSNAAKDLESAMADKAKIEKSLTDEKRTGLQLFLENSAPDSMFGAAGDDVSEIFIRRGNDCAVVIDFAPDVQVVPASDRTTLPSLNGYTVLSMRAAYRKVAICRDGSKIEAQVEKGFLYRALGSSTERVLVVGKESSSCDKASNDIKAAAILGDSKYETINPYRGEMDGIETIDFPANYKNLRLHMGSAVVGAPNCGQAAKIGAPDDLVAIACAVAVDKTPDNLSVTKGCFSKKSFLGRESTRFTAE